MAYKAENSISATVRIRPCISIVVGVCLCADEYSGWPIHSRVAWLENNELLARATCIYAPNTRRWEKMTWLLVVVRNGLANNYS